MTSRFAGVAASLDTYSITSRRPFKGIARYHQLFLTGGTIFHSRKMAFSGWLGALALFANVVKGVSALRMAGEPESGSPRPSLEGTPDRTRPRRHRPS